MIRKAGTSPPGPLSSEGGLTRFEPPMRDGILRAAASSEEEAHDGMHHRRTSSPPPVQKTPPCNSQQDPSPSRGGNIGTTSLRSLSTRMSLPSDASSRVFNFNPTDILELDQQPQPHLSAAVSDRFNDSLRTPKNLKVLSLELCVENSFSLGVNHGQSPEGSGGVFAGGKRPRWMDREDVQ